MAQPDKTTGLFVTATDTGVGKTYLTAMIARSLCASGVRVGAYKPVASGAERNSDGTVVWSDVRILREATGGHFEDDRICPTRLEVPLAPPVAARREGTHLDFNHMCTGAAWWLGRVEVLLVEGVGGLLCPLTEDKTIADLAVALGYPLLIVARLGLGTINHTLLTVEAARNRGLEIAGIVLNEAEPLASTLGTEENPGEIERRANAPVLGIVRHSEQSAPIDWRRLMSVARRRSLMWNRD
jgi:dethiobiotin synthetase